MWSGGLINGVKDQYSISERDGLGVRGRVDWGSRERGLGGLGIWGWGDGVKVQN